MNATNTLLLKTRDNDQVAFQQLYEETSPKLFSLCMRLVKYDKATAEDVLQEAYIKIWTKATAYNIDKGSAMAWMSTIVRNQALDLLRKHKSRPILTPENEFESFEFMGKELEPGQQIVYSQDIKLFKTLIENLPKKHRECITHSVVYGRSHAEIADKMHIPLGTVKIWLSRNMKDIRNTMVATTSYESFKN